ncbi:MAG: FtsH-binding integral membrane protein [Paraglaciecola sp.]|jgi:FtsH-binding integral membrane protein
MSENMDENNEVEKNNYAGIISSLRSPMSMFGLAMLICNAIFSTSAVIMRDLNAFNYSIHTFLAIVFLFVMIAIWSPRTLYHPADLKGLEKEVPEIKHSRLIITLIMLLVGSAYAVYQKTKQGNNMECSATLIEPKSKIPSENFYNIKCLASFEVIAN